MSVRWRPDRNCWQTEWREAGRGSKKRGKNFKSKREAEAFDARVKLEKRAYGSDSPVVSPKKVTIGWLAEEFLKWVEVHRAPKTMTYYKDRCTSVFSIISRHVLVQNIKRYIKPLIEEKLGKVDNGTINKDLKFFKRLMSFAVKEELLERNPLANLEYLPENIAEKRKNKPFYDVEQVNRFLKHTPRERRALYLLFFGVGLRKGELSNITWDDINFESGELRVIGKGSKLRTIPLPEDVVEVLQEHPRVEGTNYLFPNKKGGPLGDIRRSTWLIMEEAGLTRLTFHQMRDSFASNMLMAGANMKSVQEILGHEQFSTTMDIYGHVTKAHLKETMKRTSRMRGRANPPDDGGGKVIPISKFRRGGK